MGGHLFWFNPRSTLFLNIVYLLISVKTPKRESGEPLCGNGDNCYTTNKGINETVSCHKECLGGCFQDAETGRQGDPHRDQCFSCQNVYWKTADSNAHDCMPECLPGHFKVGGTQNILLNIISGMKVGTVPIGYSDWPPLIGLRSL